MHHDAFFGTGTGMPGIFTFTEPTVLRVVKYSVFQSLPPKPMLVVAGKNDPRVPMSESDQIVAALRKQGTPVWYVLGKDEGHGFQKKPNQDFEFYSDVVFLQEHLLK